MFGEPVCFASRPLNFYQAPRHLGDLLERRGVLVNACRANVDEVPGPVDLYRPVRNSL